MRKKLNYKCDWKRFWRCLIYIFLYFLLGGLECNGHSFVYVAHFVFLRDVWIRTQRAAVASRRATNLANHLPKIYFWFQKLNFKTRICHWNRDPYPATQICRQICTGKDNVLNCFPPDMVIKKSHFQFFTDGRRMNMTSEIKRWERACAASCMLGVRDMARRISSSSSGGRASTPSWGGPLLSIPPAHPRHFCIVPDTELLGTV